MQLKVNKSNNMKIVLTGGGTGGHLFPLIAVAEKIRHKLGKDVDFLYVGSGARMEKDVMSQNNIKAKFVKSGKLRRYFSLQNFVDIFKIPVGFIQSLWILLWYMPDVVFSKGGYVALPIVMAAWIYRIPVLIHESDAAPGMANRFLASFATRIAVAYPGAEKYFPTEKTALVGNPIREDINKGDAILLRKKLGFTQAKKTILILGGSQGSKVINEAVIKSLRKLLSEFQIIHQTGENNFDSIVHEAAEEGIKAGREGYYPVKFLSSDMLNDSFALCDLVISRAGANTIAEIAANAKPAILIPLDGSANDHQRKNAYDIAKAGGALVLEETNLGEHILMGKIEKILSNENLKNQMSEKIKNFYHPTAAEVIAKGVMELASN